MKKKINLLALLLCVILAPSSYSQPSTDPRLSRPDDHFWKKRVICRVDLSEKINYPMVKGVPKDMYDGFGRFQYTEGLAAALMTGLKEGRFQARDPQDLTRELTFSDLERMSKRFSGDLAAKESEWGNQDDWEDDWEVQNRSGSEWTSSDPEGDSDPADFGSANGAGTDNLSGIEMAPLEETVELIEDWIFDKNRSEMVHLIKYIRLVWVDPSETIPDELFACFKYDDVRELLDETIHINSHNEAEARSIKEVLDLRMFNSYIINVSGRGVKSLPESLFRKNQLVEYEHHLWNY